MISISNLMAFSTLGWPCCLGDLGGPCCLGDGGRCQSECGGGGDCRYHCGRGDGGLGLW